MMAARKCRTAPMSDQSASAAPITLLHLTDTHLHAAPDSKMRGVNTFETLTQVLATVQQQAAWPPTGILATGDLVQDESRMGYERFKTCMQSLGPPVYCIAGNHDDPALMSDVLSDPPFQVNGQVQLGSWTIVLLSTHRRGDDGGYLNRQALDYLDAALTANSARHALIVMHHQPIPMGSAWLDSVGLRKPEEFLKVLDGHANVRGVLWGHVHQASDRIRNNVRMLSTPSTCSQFLPEAEFFALDDSPPGFRWLQLNADGSLETSVGWASS